MKDPIAPIPLPPVLKNPKKSVGYFRDYVFDRMRELARQMQTEISESAGPDVRQKREWMLEGANRVIYMVRSIKYRGRKWKLTKTKI